MADAWKIGIQLALTGGYAHQMTLLAQQFGMLHAQVGQIQQGIGRWGTAIAGVGAVVAGSAMIKAVVSIAKHGETVVDQMTKAKVAGLSLLEVQQEYNKAVEISTKVRGSAIDKNIAMMTEMYSIAGFEDALALAPQMAQIDQIVHRFGGKAGGSYELIKALDLMGKTSDPITKKFDPELAARWLDVFTQITEATAGKVGERDLLAYAKQGGPMSGQMTPEGMRVIGSLIQDMGGFRTGTALQAIGRQFVGEMMTQSKAEELHRLGILGNYTVGKGGHIVVGKDQMKMGEDVLESPLKMAKMFSDAFTAAGITDPKDVQKETFKVFSTGPAQRLMYELIRNFQQKINEAERMAGAMTTGQAGATFGAEDPVQMMANLTTAWSNLGEVLGKPMWDPGSPAMQAMARLTGVIESLTVFAAAHPEGVAMALTAIAALGGGLVVAGIVAIAVALGSLALIAGGIAAAALAIGAFAALNWDAIKAFFTAPDLWSRIGTAIMGAASGGIAAAGIALGAYIAENYGAAIMAAWRSVTDGIPSLLSGFGSAILDSLRSAVTFVVNDIPTLFNQLGAAIMDALNAIVASVRGMFVSPPAGAPAAPSGGINIPLPHIPGFGGGGIETPAGAAAPSGGINIPLPYIPGFGGGGIETPGSAAAPKKQSFNAVPPPAGGSQGGDSGAVYLDATKVGEVIAGKMAKAMGGPLQGSAFYDGTQSSPASDLSLSYG